MLKALFEIEPLECPSCGKKIEDILLKQNGVLSVKIFSTLGKIRAEIDEDKIEVEHIETLIEGAGHKAKLKKIIKGDVDNDQRN